VFTVTVLAERGVKMGGVFSGTWERPYRKPLVENALALNVTSLKRAGLVAPETQGRTTWTVDGEVAARADIEIGPEHDGLMFVFVQGCFGSFGGDEHVLRLAAVPLWHGGLRWWLLCPFCNGRFGKLFWNEGRHHFLCRKCGGLTYYSTRVAHQQERMIAMVSKVQEKFFPEMAAHPGRRKKAAGNSAAQPARRQPKGSCRQAK
jgi:hypothetical protein